MCALIGFQSCELVGDAQKQGIFFETDRSHYIPGDTIYLTFENRTGNPLSLRSPGYHPLSVSGGCDTGFQRLTESGWQPVIDPTLEDNRVCSLPGFESEPGALVSSEFPIPSWLAYGTYRFELRYAIERTLDRDQLIVAHTEPFQYFASLPGEKA